MAFGHAVVSS